MSDLEELDDFFEEYQPLDIHIDYSVAGNQWITFKLGSETYGIDILKVQELIGYTNSTVLPNMPSFFKGMLNLRGLVIPIVDLRLKFSMKERGYDRHTVIIVVQVGDKLMGIGVDSISDLIFLSEDQIQPVQQFSTSIDIKYIHGIGRFKEEMIILLNVDYMLSKDEFDLVLNIPDDLIEKFTLSSS